MARALIADPSTATITVALSGAPAGVVTLTVRRKGGGHAHASGTFGPLTGCHRLPSVRVFDHCGPPSGCCDSAPHHTPECSGRVDIPECATGCAPGCGHHDAHGGPHHGHHHHETSVTYTAAVTGCKAVFTLDENIHDAPPGYYMADLMDNGVCVKTLDLVVRATGLRAAVATPEKVC